MSLWMIAWRSIQQRGLASALTAFSMALGVMLVVVVLTIHGVVSESFHNNSSLGYNMIVGARGGSLQLTLNTVYYLSEPVENVPYDYYLEFLPAEQRQKEVQNSYAVRVHDAEWETSELAALSAATTGPMGPQSIATLLAMDSLEVADAEPLERDRPGQFALYTEIAIPVCLGDYYDRYRVVGTTPDLFDNLVYDLENDRKFEFAEGRNFETFNEKNGYFEAVVGSKVARDLNVKLGDQIAPTHGAQEGDTHAQTFTVVGILAQSGTPNDRAVFINMEGFFLMEDHAKDIEREDEEEADATSGPPTDADATESSNAHDARDDDHEHSKKHWPEPLPIEEREVTSILLLTNTFVTPGVQNQINEGGLESSLNWSNFRPARNQKSAQAVLPIQEIYNLFAIIVTPIQWALLALTAMICVVSGVSILVSIYNSMSERRHEIAVMRALGAGRVTVMTVILLESIMLAIGGGLAGWLAGHALVGLVGPLVEAETGVAVKIWYLAPPMNILYIIAGLFGVGGVLMCLASYGAIVWQVSSVDMRRGLFMILPLIFAAVVVFCVFAFGVPVFGFNVPTWLAVVLSSLIIVGVTVGLVAAIVAIVRYWQTVRLALLFFAIGVFLLFGVGFAFSPYEINVTPEVVLIPALVLLAIVVGIFPAMSAYQTDVAKSLGK